MLQLLVASLFSVMTLLSACTQEQQNRLSRSIQNWTGTNGVLDILNGGKVAYRFIDIDKISTAEATSGSQSRPYRYGYGVFDLDQDYQVDENERKLYFEISDYSTVYIFYENPYLAEKP